MSVNRLEILLKESRVLIEEIVAGISCIEKDVQKILCKKEDIDAVFQTDEEIVIALAGQYSAGKSSIVKILTGDKDIKIGAAITTQESKSYDWNGIKIYDTPGIQTGVRPDHDENSYKTFEKADVLVYVVTNELFDDVIGASFRKMAIEKDKAEEMLLVINKMGRTKLGNCREQQDIIIEDLRKVLQPKKLEDIQICFLDAVAYLDSFKETDLGLKEELVEESGYEGFIQALNKFVEGKAISGKITTPLYKAHALLTRVGNIINNPDEDEDWKLKEEQWHQEKSITVEERKNIRQDIHSLAENYGRRIGLSTVNQTIFLRALRLY